MKRFLGIISGSLTPLVLPIAAYAQQKVEVCPKDSNFDQLCQIAKGDVGSIVEKVVVLLFIIAVLIALFFLIWGGIKWILSGGDKGGVEAARNMIIAAIIGLVITLASFFILNLVLKFFGVDLFSLTLPAIGV